MKKSNSLFVLSRLSNHRALPLFLSLSVVIFSVACRNRSVDTTSSPAELVSSEKVANSSPLAVIMDSIKPLWIPLKDSFNDDEAVIAWISGQACIEDRFQLKVHVVTGLQSAHALIDQKWDDMNATVDIDGVSFQLKGGSLTPTIRDHICNAIRSNTESVVIPSVVASEFKSAIERTLTSFVTDCRSIEPTNDGWNCSLTSMMPQTAISRIEEFQQAMIKKWSRQPYVLARRAGMTMTLARLATRITEEASIHKFCKLMQFSLPEEMTLVMTSTRWQKNLCDGNERQRREAAFYGLEKSVAELSMIRQLYESASKVGVFSLRIPNSEIPGRTLSGLQPLRVTIVPEAEVTDRLIEMAEEILGRRQPSESPYQAKKLASLDSPDVHLEPRKTQCWHPMFSDSPGLMRVADGMRLTGDGFRGDCKVTDSDAKPVSENPLARYIMQSLTSETEFVMDNGQTKLLRLPLGKYQYSVQLLPQNPVDADEVIDSETPSSLGSMDWGSARDQIIRSWN